MMRNILLITPDDRAGSWFKSHGQPLFLRIWQPLELANAANLLVKDGFNVRIIDNRIEKHTLSRLTEIGNTFDMVFISSAPHDRWQCPPLDIGPFVETARAMKSSCLYILGPHVTERAETLLNITGAHAAVLGEPEQVVLDLARAGRDVRAVATVPGIAYKSADKFMVNPACGRKYDFEFHEPAFHLLDMHRYHYALMGKSFTVMEGSRGCPFGCTFCYKGMHPQKFRRKNPMDLVNEVMSVRNRYNIRNIYFMDLEFGLDRDFLMRFCSGLIRKKAGVNWCCQTRVNDIDPDILPLMKKAGCSLIHMGIESGSERILRRMGKQICIEDCRRAAEELKRNRIRTALFFNAGFPGETDRDRELTLDLALDLDPTYASFHMLMPVPGTVLARESGYDPDNLPPALYPSFFSAHHDEKKLKKWVRRAYMKFYLRPHVIIRMMTQEKTVNRETLALFIEHIKMSG